MKLKNYAYRCLAVVCAIVAVSCVDENFSVDKVSTEVSVLDGKTVLPIGSFEKVSLGDLLGSDTELPEMLVRHEDGSYELFYEIPADNLTPDGFEFPTSIEIGEVGSSFPVDMPSVDFGSYTAGVNETFGLNLTGGLAGLLGDSAEFELTQSYLDWAEMMGQEVSLKAQVGDDVDVQEVKLTLPAQVKDIKKVYFADVDEGHTGARLSITLDLAGFTDVNGGGSYTFLLKSKYTNLLIEEDGEIITTNEYNKSMEIKPGTDVIKFSLYIAGLENTNAPENGEISINPSMEFNLDFELDARPGMIYAGVPQVTVSSEFALKDADVVFDSSVDLVNFTFGGEDNSSEGFSFDINTLPDAVKSINSINFSDESIFTIYAEGFDWLKDNADCVTIDMTLPKELVLRPMGNYESDEQSHTLSMSIGDITDGLQIGVEAIDLSNNDISNGISIDFKPEVRVHFTDETPISIKGFIPDEKVEIAVGLGKSTLGLESISAEIDFSYPIDESFPVGEELGKDDLEGFQLNGFGISPVLQIMVANPLTIEAGITVSIAPMVGDEVQEENAILIPATIKKAIFDEATGEVVPTTTRIVLAKEEHRAKYPESEGYTFIECNLDNLFASSIPDRIAISGEVGLPKGEITLHVSDSLEFGYGGSFSLPIAFDNQLDISYEKMIDIPSNEGDTLLTKIIEQDGIKIGDIALVAEIETTLPLELAVTTTLYGKDGAELPTKIGFAEGSNAIKGSSDGVTPVKHPLRLQFNLADESGSLKELADIAAVGLKIGIASNAEEGAVSLKEDQYIAADLKLELDGGLTVDIRKIKMED